jgi:large repetitive protein
LDRTHIRILASICLVVAGVLFAILLLSSGKVAADVDLIAKNANIKFTVDGQETTHPTVNDAVTIKITVVNQGTDTNATNFNVRFSDGGTIINTVLVGSNVAYGGGTANVSTSWTAKGPGVHTINIMVDSANVTADSNKTNNQASKNLDVNIAPSIVLNANPLTDLTLNNIAFNTTGSSDSDGFIVSYFWAFGDGAFDAKESATHAYKDNGVYTVTLLITDNDGGTNNTNVQITINNRAPVARAVDQTALTYTTMWFDAANSTDADGSVVNMTWYFHGPDIFMYGKKVSYTFTENAVYTITLSVKDDDGATDTKDIFATITNRAPVAHISANRTRINNTEAITFKGDASTDKDGTISNYTWMFPGGIKRYGPQVSYTFNKPNGSYQITLIVSDNDGSIGFTSLNIKVGNKKPVVSPGLDIVAQTKEDIDFDGSFSYDPDGSIVNYTWDMGNGAKRYNSSFAFSYPDDGIFTVRLTVIDDEGASNSSTLKATILNQPPIAAHTHVTITTFQQFWFDTSESVDVDGYIASVVWVFQNYGGSYSTINMNTTYSWNDNGTYLVTETVTDDDGAMDACVFNVTVTNSNPWALFSYSPTTGLSIGDNITFDASASHDLDGTIVNWIWTWGDNSAQGSGETAVHSYAHGGFFRVELVVIDNDGGANFTFRMLFIAPKNTAPVPAFTITAPEMLTNRTISFDATGSFDPDGYITKYLWAFGDGKTASGKSVSHKYLQPGQFKVTLTIEDNGTKQNSTSQNLTLTIAPNLPPIANINVNGKVDVIAGETMIFDGRASYDPDGSIANYTWDFGDSTYKYSAYVTKAFAESAVGQVTVKLTVRDNKGAMTSTQVILMVKAPPTKNKPPTAQFSMNPVSPVETGTQLTFSAQGSTDTDGTITGYQWLFGDGTTAEGQSVTHIYNNNMVYQVTLTVIDNGGETGTISKDLTVVNRAPIAAIKTSKSSALTFDTITFDGGVSSDPDGAIRTYTWVFGEEKVTKTGKIVTYAFTHPGTPKVTLKIMDDDGATGTTDITFQVNNRPPVAKAQGDLTVLEESAISLDGSGSTDIDGTITTYSWDLPNFVPATQSGKIVQIMAPKLEKKELTKTFNFKLTVTDNSGALSNEFHFNVTIVKKPVTPPTPKPKGFIPGFDAVLAVASIGVAVSIIALRKKR